jgi:hypothetical protein
MAGCPSAIAVGWRSGGLADYSLGVHDCQAPGGSDATAALMLRFTDAGLVAEGDAFGLVAA